MRPNHETQQPITDFDLYLIGEGTHFRSYEKFGARLMSLQGVAGVYFAVWAPNARSVSLVGNFNNWQQTAHPMDRLESSGVWELFVPGLGEGEMYKYAVLTSDDHWHLKADPYAFQSELRPHTASIVCSLDKYVWKDEEWMKARPQIKFTDIPISIYEVHLGSWKASPQNKLVNYRDLAREIVAYVLAMGYSHIELLPIMEHPLDESWGYQIINYYAPTSRFGKPEDLMYFIDTCHQNGIGVILDWVPGHFPKDEHGLINFDGKQVYAYQNWKKGEQKEWGTLVFDFGRREVSNFLISNADFWLEKYHVDGLRVDAVASMLYLDYSRRPGEWEPNIFGGHENLEAIDFIKKLNTVVHANHPGIVTIAEESTSWPDVSRPVNYGGLGFDMKWNMGWMHDTLSYFSKDPIFRKYHQGQLTFSLVYAFSENFILPISHDEVVYGKGSLLSKMPGDDWQKFANTRLFLTYMFSHPGKKLLFMGNDMGQWREWDSHGALDWEILGRSMNDKFHSFVRDLQFLYRNYRVLYQQDFNFHGFEWIDFLDVDQSVVSFLRWSKDYKELLIFTFNMTSVPRHSYRIGVPYAGFYKEILNSDAVEYGGSGVGNFGGSVNDDIACHSRPYSLSLNLPPFGSKYFLLEEGRLKMENNYPAIVIEGISPCIDDGSFAAKCVVGEKFLVEADIFKDGHNVLGAALLFRKKTHPQWSHVPMRLMENDRWQAFFIPDDNARYLYTIEAWVLPDGPKTRYKHPLELVVDRKAAEYSAWYEFFPRSQGKVPYRSATFKDCLTRLEDIKKMGFDIIYLPPIHPIGITSRKGPDNMLKPTGNSPGSPWAIGNKEGGHKSIHPDLGGFDEFKIFTGAAKDMGLEIALDLAFQCSPDHPYVKEHPQWFYHRPDGSIHYAENPPKKYEDIYPLNFNGEDREGLWEELKSIVIFWIEKGIHIFRVDNPHTKPLYFWKWLIDEVQQSYPQVIFLSEAFSRPRIMKFLAKAGFTQSYTYFTWRNSKWELCRYLQELTGTDMKYYFRGNFFTNTPDILPEYLQKGGGPAFKIRTVLASTLSSVYGIYSGFELCENQAKPDSEEYLNSEKYEIKTRDWDQPGNIKDFITRINTIRRENPALQKYKNLEFYETFSEHLICYGKRTVDNSNMIVVVVNLDPFATHEDMVTLPLWKLGLQEGQTYQMHDLLTGVVYPWKGASNYVRLDPHHNPAHIFKIKP